jgi:septal ring factor EnvC (AmiA/AmiB activator)
MTSETPIIENHADMHRDHREWNSEQICWRNDLRSWQHELANAREELKQIEAALKDHETTLQKHGSAVRLSEQEMDAHEHALTEFEQGGAGDELLAMIQKHRQEASLHAEQRAAHERLKRQHHAVVARLRHVLAAFSEARPGAEPAARAIVT